MKICHLYTTKIIHGLKLNPAELLRGQAWKRSEHYTAISRKVVGKNVHVTIPKGHMGYDQYTVPDDCSCEPTFVVFL